MAVHVITTKTNLFMDLLGLLHAFPQDSGICIECGETEEYVGRSGTKLATILPTEDPHNPCLIDL
jgi:hypothetical protein